LQENQTKRYSICAGLNTVGLAENAYKNEQIAVNPVPQALTIPAGH